MKYSININQLVLSRIAPNITLTDAAILDYLLNFYSLSQTSPGNYKTIFLNNRQFLWIDFQNLLDEMPLLKIKSKGGLSKALSRLTGPRLIDKYLYKNELYIRPGAIVQELFFDGRKPKCEWCGSVKEPWHIIKLNFPIPKTLGGKETVSICKVCSDQFHYGNGSVSEMIKAKRLLQETALTNKGLPSVSYRKLEYNITTVTNNNSPTGEGAKAPEPGKGDPRVKQVIEYFSQMCNQIKGFKPVINWGAEGAMVKRYLKDYSDSNLNQAFMWFLESEESDRLGCTIKVALSNYVFNKWLAQRNL